MLLSILFIAGGFFFFSWYYGRQIDFLRIHTLTRSIDISFRSGKDRDVDITIKSPGAVIDRSCRILTEPGSLTRIRVLDRGVLVLRGSCDISIKPYRRYFWFLHRGEIAFFPLVDGAFPGDRTTAVLPLDFSVSAGKRSVDQGRILVLRVRASGPVRKVSGSLGWRGVGFFPVSSGTNSPAEFHAVQGVDLAEKAGISKIAIRAESTNGQWLLRVYPYRVNRRRYFRPYRRLAREVRVKPPRWSRRDRNRWWRRWIEKRKYILSENRPTIEWRQLQPLFRNVDHVRYWRGRFLEPMLRYQRVSSPFGEVRYLTSGNGVGHRGIDYASPEGWPVRAAARGRVAFAAMTIVRGGLVIVDHGCGVQSAYMHLSRVLARSNAMVRPGQRIGLVGTTGLSTGPHLHFGVKAGNVYVDPGEWMAGRPYPPYRYHPLGFTDDPDRFQEPDKDD